MVPAMCRQRRVQTQAILGGGWKPPERPQYAQHDALVNEGNCHETANALCFKPFGSAAQFFGILVQVTEQTRLSGRGNSSNDLFCPLGPVAQGNSCQLIREPQRLVKCVGGRIGDAGDGIEKTLVLGPDRGAL